MRWLRPHDDEKDIESLNKAQDTFHESINTNDFDVIHEHRLNKDRHIKGYTEKFGSLPPQDPYNRRYY